MERSVITTEGIRQSAVVDRKDPEDLPYSDRHLWRPPQYRTPGGLWCRDFWSTLKYGESEYFWDPASILSMVSFTYSCGDRTLLRKVARQPWLSSIQGDGTVSLVDVPPHGRNWIEPDEAARNLEGLLRAEMEKACSGRSEIYLLLSGGLDSRIVAAIAALLYGEGSLPCKPCAVTWGLSDSRDVVYARRTAEILGLNWHHIPIGPHNLLENIDLSAEMGCLVPPNDLHCMSWFKQVPHDAIVLAGSYGDSVGRAEFRGSHLLQLNPLQPVNMFNLIRAHILDSAGEGIADELTRLRARTPGSPPYVLCEHEAQGHYMRGLIAQAMTVIHRHCPVYQMFTDPAVYSYMWSIHPSKRDNRIYSHLLMRLNQRLARLPWARTNRALSGSTEGARKSLGKEFHTYASWIRGPLMNDISSRLKDEWFEESGLFNVKAIEGLIRFVKDDIHNGTVSGFRPYSMCLWLCSLREFARKCEEEDINVSLHPDDVTTPGKSTSRLKWHPGNPLRTLIGRVPGASKLKRKLQLHWLKWKASRSFPPISKE